MVAPSIRSHPDRRVLRFSSVGGIAVIVVALVAAIALLMIIVPSLGPGLIGDASPTSSPTASVEPSTPPVSPAATPTAVATATVEPTATPAPTTPLVATWTGLTWSNPVTPPFAINLWDVLPWRDGYVAVGFARGEFAFLTSPDGLSWTVAQPIKPNWGIASSGWNLVEHRGELLAFAPPVGLATPPRVYRSTDGTSWSLVVSPSWERAWADDGLLLDVAVGADAIIAIGDARSGEHGELFAEPIVMRSTDGVTWAAVELPGASPAPVVWDVVAWVDGYAILGGMQEGSAIGVGQPQAWWSTNGTTWEPAVVEGAVIDDNHFELNTAFSAAGGLVARTQLLCAGCPPDLRGWLSTDGRVWQRATDLFVDLPSGLMSSDGTRLVAFGTDEGWRPSPGNPEPYPGLSRAWVSTDGATWQQIALSHSMTDQLEALWVVPDGVIYAGAQSFWFGTPTVP